MGREIRRVPLDFDWPEGKVWEGFLLPEHLHQNECHDCAGSGESPVAIGLKALWYGHAPFAPAETNSTPFTWEEPVILAKAKHNFATSQQYYEALGSSVEQEARRLAALYNSRWCHHLEQEDVDALLEEGRLTDLTHTYIPGVGRQKKEPPHHPTASEVNLWSIQGWGHDEINRYLVAQSRCHGAGLSASCATCEGHGRLERYPGQRKEADEWEPDSVPTGEGWQVWETVSEGSPVSPVFRTRESLISWLCTPKEHTWVGCYSFEQATAFVGSGWAPTAATIRTTTPEGEQHTRMATHIAIPHMLSHAAEHHPDSTPQDDVPG